MQIYEEEEEGGGGGGGGGDEVKLLLLASTDCLLQEDPNPNPSPNPNLTAYSSGADTETETEAVTEAGLGELLVTVVFKVNAEGKLAVSAHRGTRTDSPLTRTDSPLTRTDSGHYLKTGTRSLTHY